MAALEHEFSLDGMLVFNGLYECRVPEELDFETVLLSLPGFEEGSPESPGDGFSRIRLEDVLDSRSDLDVELLDEVRDFDHIRYTAEQYDQTVADVDGERRVVSVPSRRQVDFHWRFPDLLAARGNREDTEQALQALVGELDDAVDVQEIRFGSEFLQELFEAHRRDWSGLVLDRVTEVDLRSTSGKFGQVNRVSATGESLSAESVALDTEGHKIASLGGGFRVGEYDVPATVSTDGRVHVRAAGDVQSKDDYGRTFLGLAFLNRLVRAYREWERNE